MRGAVQIGAVLVLAMASVAFGQPKAVLRPAAKGFPKGLPKKGGPVAGPMLNPPKENVERLLAMTPDQRDRALEKLPRKQQENLRRRFEQFDKLPPEERARRIEMWKRFESLPPEKREILSRQMQAFKALPEDRLAVMRPALNRLSRLSPEERQARLNSEAFKNRFSPAELQMLSDLTENSPLPGR
jgi:hypothetical protein